MTTLTTKTILPWHRMRIPSRHRMNLLPQSVSLLIQILAGARKEPPQPLKEIFKIIQKVKVLHDIPGDVLINHQTVRKRCARNSKNGNSGHTSPMAEIEPYIVELAIKLAEMRVPITSKQGLQLANSLIKGSAFHESVLLWKQNNCSAFRERGTQELGPGYWNGLVTSTRCTLRSMKAW
mmetsp:Transcript_25081/g.35923  ORF Transcript_25081/g.35923 Transcript_25081/m.35923 type:complete len:179 (+) Transcript_25081:210-746(+)